VSVRATSAQVIIGRYRIRLGYSITLSSASTRRDLRSDRCLIRVLLEDSLNANDEASMRNLKGPGTEPSPFFRVTRGFDGLNFEG
jgi:hypothetical protein